MAFKSLGTLAAAVLLANSPALAQINLPALNIDTGNITVSGLSSGGFMANQLGVAHSSLFKGVGVFAAGPYQAVEKRPARAAERDEGGKIART